MAIGPIILIAYGGSNLQQVLLAHSLELEKLANQVFGFVGGLPGPYHRKLVFLDRYNQKIATEYRGPYHGFYFYFTSRQQIQRAL